MGSSIKETLPTMFALARERTEMSRIQLAGMLADVFLQGSVDLTLREEEQVNELITSLMTNASPTVRAHLVKKFADVAKMPRTMAANSGEGRYRDCASHFDVLRDVDGRRPRPRDRRQRQRPCDGDCPAHQDQRSRGGRACHDGRCAGLSFGEGFFEIRGLGD